MGSREAAKRFGHRGGKGQTRPQPREKSQTPRDLIALIGCESQIRGFTGPLCGDREFQCDAVMEIR
jgi:hypothetical protein